MGMTKLLLDGYTGVQFMKDLRGFVGLLVSAAAVLLVLYAVYIGYLFATASDEGKRKAAKTRLVKVVGSIMIVIALGSILAVIEVRFSNVEGEVPETSIEFGDSAAQSKWLYSIPAGTTMQWSVSSGGKVTGKFEFDNVANINDGNGGKPTNPIFTKGQISDMAGLPANDKTGTSAFKVTTSKITFNYEYDSGDKTKPLILSFRGTSETSTVPVLTIIIGFAYESGGKNVSGTAIAHLGVSPKNANLQFEVEG